jgi:hypothetical protein
MVLKIIKAYKRKDIIKNGCSIWNFQLLKKDLAIRRLTESNPIKRLVLFGLYTLIFDIGGIVNTFIYLSYEHLTPAAFNTADSMH